MGDTITQAKMCFLQNFLNINDNGRKLPQDYIETLNRLNNPTYGYLMVSALGNKLTTSSLGVYASGFNINGSYQINSSGNVVTLPCSFVSGSTPGSQIAVSSNQLLPSYILFTSNGTLTVSNLTSGQFSINVIVVGGGGGGGAGGGKSRDSSKAGSGGGGGGTGGYSTGTITSNGTFAITVGQGAYGGECKTSGDSGGIGSSGKTGNPSSISGPNVNITAGGGYGGGGGGVGAQNQSYPGPGNGGGGGTGTVSGKTVLGASGGNGISHDKSETSGGTGIIVDNSTFKQYLYIGGGGGGGFQSSQQNNGGNPQGSVLFNDPNQNDGYGPFWGAGGADQGNGISACSIQNNGGKSSLFNYVGGGGGGGGRAFDSAYAAIPGGPGGTGANGCVLVWWTQTL